MARTEAPMLVITEGALAGQRWPIDQEVVLIGRSETCDLVLPERQISRQHARLRRQDDGYYIEDLGSKNGTFLNGQPLPPFVPHRLKDGDELALALCVRMRFVSPEVTRPLEAPPAPARFSGLRIDRAARRVWANGREVVPRSPLPSFAPWSAWPSPAARWSAGRNWWPTSGPRRTPAGSPSRPWTP